MRRSTWIVAGTIAIGLLGGGAGVAIATAQQDDGPGQPITGTALDRAKSAALKHTGEGRVTGTEINDEEGKYEVEVTKPDGSQVDVHLNDKFSVLSTLNDGREATDTR